MPSRPLTAPYVRASHAVLWVVSALGLAAVGAAELQAQDRELESGSVVLLGKVVDAQSGVPLHGAFVTQDGQSGYLTHDDGSFALPVWPYGVYTLTIELLGYETLQVEIEGPEPEPVLIRVSPDPIILQELTVLVDRFERRRRRVPVSVRAFDRQDLLRAPLTDVVDWAMGRNGIHTRFCAAGAPTGLSGRGAPTLASISRGFGVDAGQECVLRRGRFVRPEVYIDDVRAFGGLDELRTYTPQDLYTIEIYDRGTVIYAYTPWFVDRVLKGRRSLRPVMFFR